MNENITLKIDNREISVPKGTTILEAARDMGIDIPTLCYMNLKDLCIKNAPASCRLCVVEVEGRKNLAPSCHSLRERHERTHEHDPGTERPQDRVGTHVVRPPVRLSGVCQIR